MYFPPLSGLHQERPLQRRVNHPLQAGKLLFPSPPAWPGSGRTQGSPLQSHGRGRFPVYPNSVRTRTARSRLTWGKHLFHLSLSATPATTCEQRKWLAEFSRTPPCRRTFTSNSPSPPNWQERVGRSPTVSLAPRLGGRGVKSRATFAHRPFSTGC